MFYRRYGPQPITVVAVHGGPGGPGEVAPLAAALGESGVGVLEPFQSQRTIDALVAELAGQIAGSSQGPVALIGWSWGAWLATVTAAAHPDLVRTLVLVASGPFEEEYAKGIRSTRLARLTENERALYDRLGKMLVDPHRQPEAQRILDKTDQFAPIDTPDPPINFQRDQYEAVWAEAAALRASGQLIEHLQSVQCPIHAYHGDHDPHPAEGIRAPLIRWQPKARFTLLARCGHKPWRERFVRASFLSELHDAVR
ncbi:MAG: alpha/beta hydrolase [Pseudomonadota bacterium]